MADLTYAEVAAALKYEPETGRLFWLPRNPETFKAKGYAKKWNGQYAGKEAFTAINTTGYRYGAIRGKYLLRSRVAWLLHHGRWPEHDIDHIDGTTDNDRIANLRDVPTAINMRNCRMSTANTSGVTGVYWMPSLKKWRARITVDGAQKSLGCYDSIEDATSARMKAQKEHGFTARHGT